MLDSLDTLIAFALIFTIVSLLITIVVQMITSLSNLRGKNLSWGIAEAFEAIAPELKAEVKQRGKVLADHLLHDPLISDSQFWNLKGSASAVRADELFDLMHRIALNKKPGTPDAIKNDIITLFKNLGVPASVFELLENEKKQLENLRADIVTQLAALPDGLAKEQLQKVKMKTEASLANAAAYTDDAAIRWAAQGEKEIKKVYEKFEHWFETGQERSQEWFTTHARIITAILGVAFAFALQLDTIEIFTLVSSNRQVRDSLVAQSANILKDAEHVLGDTQYVLKTGLDNWRVTLKPVEKVPEGLKGLKVEAGDTRGTLVAKVEATLTAVDTRDEWLNSFGTNIDSAVQKCMKEKAGDYRTVAADLDKSGFALFPKNNWKRWSDWPNHWKQHFLGVLFSALLLSLGAPFWFNTLKNLASLRSSVAANISEEKEAEQKNAKIGKSSRPPPTVK